MRYLKTYKLYKEEIDIDNIDPSELDDIYNALKNDKVLISEITTECEDMLVNISDIVETSINVNTRFIKLEINAEAYTYKDEYADSDDDVEFILGETEVSDLKQLINVLKSDGYGKISLCISMNGDDNFEDIKSIITDEQAKSRLNEIKNKPIGCIQMFFVK